MAELKPCPFCGRTPTVDDCGDHRYFVQCKCGVVQDKLYAQKCDAVRRWNTRKIDKDINVHSTDCISRQQAIDAVGYYSLHSGDKLLFADKPLKELPSAQPDLSSYSDKLWRAAYERGKAEAQPHRKRGHWIEIQAPDRDGNALYECSICHSGETHTPVVEVPFCWHCGAKMDGGEQDEA